MLDIDQLFFMVKSRIHKIIIRAQAEIQNIKSNAYLQEQRKQILETCEENPDVLLQYGKGNIERFLTGSLLQEYHKAYFLFNIKRVTKSEQAQYKEAKKAMIDVVQEIRKQYDEMEQQKPHFTIEELEAEIMFCEEFLKTFGDNIIDEVTDFSLLEHIIMNQDFFSPEERNQFLTYILQNNMNHYQKVEEKEKKKALTALRKKEREEKKRQNETISLTPIEKETLDKIKQICEESRNNKTLLSVTTKEMIEQAVMCIVNDTTRMHIYDSFDNLQYRKTLIEKDCQNLLFTYQEILEVMKKASQEEREEWMKELYQAFLSMHLAREQYEQVMAQMLHEKEQMQKENKEGQYYQLLYLTAPSGIPYLSKDAKKIPDAYKKDIINSLEELKQGKFFSKYGSDRMYIADKKTRGYKEKREEKTKVLYRRLGGNYLLVTMARLHIDTATDLAQRIRNPMNKSQIEAMQNIIEMGGEKLQELLKQNTHNEILVQESLQTEVEMRQRR